MKKVSVILPTFNEEKRIFQCLKSVASQKYQKNKIELIVVDDTSTDKTIEIAKSFGAKVLTNGSKNIERGKSIGLANVTGEYVFFIDADNQLLHKDWFAVATEILDNDREIIGVQSYRYKYYPSDPIANRYCSLFGINDPMAFYLNKRGQQMYSETNWIHPDNIIEETKNAYICSYSIHDLPTVGSQGYMTRTDLVKQTNWKPFLFHMDSVYEIVQKGHSKIAFIKRDIKHDYTASVMGILKKLRRNITLFYKQSSQRKYKYDISRGRLLIVIVIMSTFIVPLYHSIKGYIKKPDMAWFLHPILSFAVVMLYSYTTVEHYALSHLSRMNE